MPIEIRPVIGIETQDGKGQRRLDFGDALCHLTLSAVKHCAGLRPLGMLIGRCQAPAKLSGHTLSAGRQGVGLDKARCAYIPMLGANRDLCA